MKKKTLFLFVCLILGALELKSTNVTGVLRDLSGNPVSTNAYLEFELRNYGTTPPRVLGSNAIVPIIKRAYPDASGNISVVIQDNNTITPPNTYYRTNYFYGGAPGMYCEWTITGTAFNINTATCQNSMTPPPPLVPANADQTYLRLDLGNSNLMTRGMAGAISAPIFDQNGQVFNVKTYGAIGNGTVDDTIAVQAAKTALINNGGGILYFPPSSGCYAFAGSVDFTGLRNAVIQGGGASGVSGAALKASCLVQLNNLISAMYPAFDFSGASWVYIKELMFGYATGGSANATILLQRSTNKGFCSNMSFINVSINPGAQWALFNNSCEVVNFFNTNIDAYQHVGTLFTTYLTGYSIASAYATAGGGSMSSVHFFGGQIVGSSGTNVILDGTQTDAGHPSGVPIEDFTFHGTYFANAGTSAIGIQAEGLVNFITVDSARFELPSGTNSPAHFIDANNATLKGWNINGIHLLNASYFLYSTASASINSFQCMGNCPINIVGTLHDAKIRDIGLVQVIATTVDGGDYFGAAGASGAVWNVGSVQYPFRWQGFGSVYYLKYVNGSNSPQSFTVLNTGHLIASYAYDVCEFAVTADAANNSYTINSTYINSKSSSVLNNTGYGTITCPPNGKGTNVITATFNTIGDWFMVRYE